MGRIVIAVEDDPGAGVEAALAALPWAPAPRPLALLLPEYPLPPGVRQARKAIERWCRLAGAGSVRSVHTATGIGLLCPPPSTVEMPLPQAAQRFSTALVPAALPASERMVVASLPDGGARRSPLALLAAFASPRQRLAARFAGEGVRAELAAALCPASFVLVGEIAGLAATAATSDPVAAELLWLAIKPTSDTSVVAWQSPTVQSAASLGLGAETAAEIDLLVVGSRGESARRALDPVRRRLGISAVAGR